MKVPLTLKVLVFCCDPTVGGVSCDPTVGGVRCDPTVGGVRCDPTVWWCPL